MVPFNQIVGYSPKHPDVLAANPKGQVPVLVDGDLTLYDSTVILEYLEDAYPEPPLHSRSPKERAACRLLDLFADEVMLVPIRAFMHRTGPRPDDPHKWEAAEAKAGGGRGRHRAAFRGTRAHPRRQGVSLRRLQRRRHRGLHGGPVHPAPRRSAAVPPPGTVGLVRPAEPTPRLRKGRVRDRRGGSRTLRAGRGRLWRQGARLHYSPSSPMISLAPAFGDSEPSLMARSISGTRRRRAGSLVRRSCRRSCTSAHIHFASCA